MVDALLRDVAAGRRSGYTTVDMLPAIRDAFGVALSQLPPAERRRFVEDDFWRYRETVRHISPTYAMAIDRLGQRLPLRVRRADVAGVQVDGHGEVAVSLRFAGSQVDSVVSGAALFDCRGFADLRDAPPAVLADLLASGIVRPNNCGRGVAVNEQLEAAPGLFVLGPLLAGTSRGRDQIWSLENIPRMYALADRIAVGVRDQLGTDPVGTAVARPDYRKGAYQ
jgi:uncharacterized NAD(P)/FAD-binding protein YdhS